MEINYKELRANGESIVLERKENIVVERSESKLIKRKQTVVRETFPCPPRNAFTPDTDWQQDSRCTGDYVPDPNVGDAGKTEFAAYIPRKGKRHQQLSDLAHAIDNEISKLKQRRDNLLRGAAKTKKVRKRSVAVQSNIVWEQNFSASKANIEFTIDKYSSQHKFVCTSPRYARDEQTWCRPRMRTIGLQKNMHRSSPIISDNKHCCNSYETYNAKANKSHPALQDLKVAKNPILPIPTLPFGCLDYNSCCKNPNDPVNVYHMQCDLQTPNCNCNCRKVCQHYNMAGNYNGVVCNQKRYVERGMSPCSEYNYCCDEYVYDYPNSCHRPSNAIYCKQPLALRTNCCGSCCRCARNTTHKHSHGGRRCTDLNTDVFYHPTQGDQYDSRKSKGSKSQLNKSRDEKLMKKYMLSIMKRKKKHRYSDDEAKSRHRGRSSEKLKELQDKEGREDREDTAKGRDDTKWEDNYRQKLRKESAAKIAKLLTRSSHKKKGDTASSDSDATSLQKVGSKEKLLQITLENEKRHSRPQHNSNCRCRSCPYNSPETDYSMETKHALKQMHVSAYEPSKPRSRGDKDDPKRSKRGKESKKIKDPSEEPPVKEDDANIATQDSNIGKEKKYAEYISQYKQDPDTESMPKGDISGDKTIKEEREKIIDSKTLPTEVKEKDGTDKAPDSHRTYGRSPRNSAEFDLERSSPTFGRDQAEEYMPASPTNVQKSSPGMSSPPRQQMLGQNIRAAPFAKAYDSSIQQSGIRTNRKEDSETFRSDNAPEISRTVSPASHQLSPESSERTQQQFGQSSQRHQMAQRSNVYKDGQVGHTPAFARDYDSNVQQSGRRTSRELGSQIYGSDDVLGMSLPVSPHSRQLSPESSQRMKHIYDQEPQRYQMAQQSNVYKDGQVGHTPARDYDSNVQQSGRRTSRELGSQIYGSDDMLGMSLPVSPHSRQLSPESSQRMKHIYDQTPQRQQAALQSNVYKDRQVGQTPAFVRDYDSNVQQSGRRTSRELGSQIYGSDDVLGMSMPVSPHSRQLSPESSQRMKHIYDQTPQRQQAALQSTVQSKSPYKSADPYLSVDGMDGMYNDYNDYDIVRPKQSENMSHYKNQGESWNDTEQERALEQPSASESSWQTLPSCTTANDDDICICNQREKIPEFTACPCMLETYLNLVTEYCENSGSKRDPCGRKTLHCTF